MKIQLLMLCCISLNAFGLQSQYQGNFRRRFGSASYIYDIPLYFSFSHTKNKYQRKSRLHKKSYRNAEQNNIKRKTAKILYE